MQRVHPLTLATATGTTCLAWSALLATADTFHAHGQARGAMAGLMLPTLWLVSLGTMLGAAWCLTFLRELASEWAEPHPVRRAGLALAQAALFAWVALSLQHYATLGPWPRAAAAVLLVGGAWLMRELGARQPYLMHGLCLVLVGASLSAFSWLSVREYPWLCALLDLCAVAALAQLTRAYFLALHPVLRASLAAVALLTVLAAPALVTASMPLRGLLHESTRHARAQATLLEPLWPEPSQVAALEPNPCPSSELARCENHRPTRPQSALFGTAGRADILLLSVDALRWDHAHALSSLVQELGPHVRFERAMSPAPHTAYSLAATLRGRPVRQVPFEKRGGYRVHKTGSQTLGHVLSSHGYRAVYAPTHRYLAKKSRVAEGFEQLVAEEHHDKLEANTRFPLQSAMTQLLRAADNTDTPIVAWLHAMETHAPFHWDGGKGPRSPAGQLHAARDLDKKLVDFLRAFKRARGERPLLVALFADHGEEFGEHGGRFHSSTVFAEQVHVMFSLAGPGLSAQRSAAPVSTAALPATLLELVGIEPPCSLTVPSLLPCLLDAKRCPEVAVSELPASPGLPAQAVGYTFAHERLLYDRPHAVLRWYDSTNDPYDRRDLMFAPSASLPPPLARAKEWNVRYCVQARGER